MNSLSARLRAIFVTFLVFGLGAFALGGIVIGLDRLPALAAFLPAPPPAPAAWLAPVLDSGAMRFTVAVFLIIGAAVLSGQSRYLDRMFEIFADVLLMVTAALFGIAAGSWAWSVIASGVVDPPFSAFIPLAGLAATIGVTLALVPHRLRPTLLLRLAGVLALLAAAPLVLTAPIFT